MEGFHNAQSIYVTLFIWSLTLQQLALHAFNFLDSGKSLRPEQAGLTNK